MFDSLMFCFHFCILFIVHDFWEMAAIGSQEIESQ